MGRSIPSFRTLIDIERLEWANFKKKLCKKDKQIFNKLFLISKLYCHALSSLSNPITIEPIILSIIFNNFKSINQIHKDSLLSIYKKFESDVIKEKIFQGSVATTIQSDIMSNANYNKIIHELKRFSESLSIDDEIIFLNMISGCYRSYRNSIYSNINNKKLQSSSFRNMSLFIAIILYQQKQIDLINNSLTK